MRKSIETALKSTIVEVHHSQTIGSELSAIRLMMSDGRVIRLSGRPNQSRENAYLVMKSLWPFFSKGPVRIAEPLAYLKQENILLYNEAEGQPLRAFLQSNNVTMTVHLVGQALRKLHNVPPPQQLPVWPEKKILSPLLAQVNKELRVFIGARLRKLIDQLGTPLVSVIIHGDPWPENFLIQKEAKIVTIIDFSDTARGDPAFDIGFFRMHCLAMPAREGWEESLWQGYGKVDKSFLHRVRLWTAINLLHNALYLETWLNPNRLPKFHPLVNKRIAQADEEVET